MIFRCVVHINEDLKISFNIDSVGKSRILEAICSKKWFVVSYAADPLEDIINSSMVVNITFIRTTATSSSACVEVL